MFSSKAEVLYALYLLFAIKSIQMYKLQKQIQSGVKKETYDCLKLYKSQNPDTLESSGTTERIAAKLGTELPLRP